jgi:hypothetical protein
MAFVKMPLYISNTPFPVSELKIVFLTFFDRGPSIPPNLLIAQAPPLLP